MFALTDPLLRKMQSNKEPKSLTLTQFPFYLVHISKSFEAQLSKMLKDFEILPLKNVISLIN